MSSELLDSILDNAVRRGGIISSNNDLSQIAVDLDAALADITAGIRSQGRDGRPAWDANEYGISAKEVQRRIALANSPEQKERLLADLKQRAIQRAGLTVTNGHIELALADVGGWHNLGTVVRGAMNGQQALSISRTGWTVSKRKAGFVAANGQFVEFPDQYILARDDNDYPLTTVGRVYKPIQNQDVIEVMDAVMGEFGAEYDVCGSLENGAKFFVVCRLPRQDFVVNGGDQVTSYAMFFQPHDGSGVALGFPTTHRAVCRNTCRTAIVADGHKAVRIRHTGNFASKTGELQRAFRRQIRAIDRFATDAKILAAKPVSNPTHYFHDVLDATLDITEAQAKLGAAQLARDPLIGNDGAALEAALSLTQTAIDLREKAFDRKIERRGEVLQDIMNRYESPTCPNDTAWDCLNAVTEHTTHNRIGRQRGSEQERAERRFESIVYGERDDMNQVALQKALAL